MGGGTGNGIGEAYGGRADHYAQLLRKANLLGETVRSEPKRVAVLHGLSRVDAKFLVHPTVQENSGYAPAGRYGNGITEEDDKTYSVHVVNPKINRLETNVQNV